MGNEFMISAFSPDMFRMAGGALKHIRPESKAFVRFIRTK
jgi:hypothetical protein